MTERSPPEPVKQESGLDFWLRPGRELDADLWFQGAGLKSVDFLVARSDGALWFVEAKSSSPQQDQPLRTFLSEVCEKVARVAAALLSLAAGRPLAPGLNTLRTTAPWALDRVAAPWEVILVIPRHEPAWLAPLRDALREALRPLARSFGFALEPKVLNAGLAQKLGLGPPSDSRPAR